MVEASTRCLHSEHSLAFEGSLLIHSRIGCSLSREFGHDALHCRSRQYKYHFSSVRTSRECPFLLKYATARKNPDETTLSPNRFPQYPGTSSVFLGIEDFHNLLAGVVFQNPFFCRIVEPQRIFSYHLEIPIVNIALSAIFGSSNAPGPGWGGVGALLYYPAIAHKSV